MSDTANKIARIGFSIKDRRKQLGMTQQDVADIAGVQRQTVSRVEVGNESVAIASVARIAAVVGLDLGVIPRYCDGRS